VLPRSKILRGIKIAPKESSREVISKWMPGSGAEDYVISAEITAVKPSTKGGSKAIPKVVVPPKKAKRG